MASVEKSSSNISNHFQTSGFDTAAIKVLADSSNLNAVPSKFNFTNESTTALIPDSLPIIDFAAITAAADPDQRSRAIQELGRACQEWGFFILVNHGVPESLMKALFTETKRFFSLPSEEKKQYEAKSGSDPIKCGAFNITTTSNQTFTLWRENLKLFAHPQCYCPDKPKLLREVVLDYTERSRKIARELLKAISDNLELEHRYIDEVLKMDSTFQLFATNFYPPCPEPDKAIGIPPHTDPGLLTFLIHNGVPGLQIQHNGHWFSTCSPHNSILVNCADQLEIFTNGRWKSVMHRAVVNSEKERISIVVSNGPAKEAIVGPAATLAQRDSGALYHSMEYNEYMETQLSKGRYGGKTSVELQMINQKNLTNTY